jgi:hypothetical protein
MFYLLSDLRRQVERIGHVYEPVDSAYHITQMASIEELHSFAEELNDESYYKLVVSKALTVRAVNRSWSVTGTRTVRLLTDQLTDLKELLST